MNNENYIKFAFVLGRETELCFVELESTLSRLGFSYDIINVLKNIIYINIDRNQVSRVAEIIDVLGGTIKIFEIVCNRTHNLEKDICKTVASNCETLDRIEFGISSFDSSVTISRVNGIGLNIKKELKKNKSVRFVALTDSDQISSIVTLKQGLIRKGIEIGIFNSEIGKLIAVSNAEEWNIRDYEKPRGDKRSGMLPPKLARIMLNLALGQHAVSSQQEILVIDPFCGSGNVLIESLMLGLNFFGTDLSAKAVNDSTLNCEWLREKNNINDINYKIGVADATTFNFIKNIDGESGFSDKKDIAVVAEPYLGEPKKFKPTLNAARGEYHKVKEMYLSFFNNFSRQLSLDKNRKLVFCLIFPLVETVEGKRYSLYRECVDEIKKIGYTELQSPLIYGRDYQVVKREIALLTL